MRINNFAKIMDEYYQIHRGFYAVFVIIRAKHIGFIQFYHKILGQPKLNHCKEKQISYPMLSKSRVES
jgi:hypothetical protein